MKKLLVTLVALLVAAPLYAQPTHDDCPPGGVKHVALTNLDHASMEAAIVASFVGLYHRQPTGVRGSGPDDIGYEIQLYDHYGAYSDGICRAGWNRYAELRLSGDDAPLAKFGDEPATFQPGASPQPPVIVPPVVVPPVAPPLDLSGVQAQLADLIAKVDNGFAGSADAHASINQNVTDGRSENRSFFSAVAAHWKQITAFVAPILATYETCHQTGKC